MRVPIVLCTLALGAGCADPTGPSALKPVTVAPEWVTGAAALAVDSRTGLFDLVPMEPTVLSRAGADSFALAYARFGLNPQTFGNTRSVLESDRGGTISAWTALQNCDRTLHAVTPFGALPVEAPSAFHRIFASRWGAVICGSGGDGEISVELSDRDLGIVLNGQDLPVSQLDSLNGAVISFGIPRVLRKSRALTAEEAVRAGFEKTGLRIVQPPRAVRRWLGAFASLICVSWELELEAPVAVPTSVVGDSLVTSTILVERTLPGCLQGDIEFRAAAPQQPLSVRVRYFSGSDVRSLDSLEVPVVRAVEYIRVWPPGT